MTEPYYRDLFDARTPYPESAGYQDTDTSKAAAEATDARKLQALVLRTFAEHGPLTADECAARLGIDKLSIRPRCTELKLRGKLRDTGERRSNISGRKAAVYRLAA